MSAVETPYADRFVTANGVRLHFQDWGGTSGKVLLMVHGITMQSHAFDPVAGMLKDRYRCVALDLRGHGDSDWSDPAGYEYAVYAEDVLALLDALGIAKVHYLGTSLGGRVAMTLAVEHAECLASLAINDVSPVRTAGGMARIVEVFGGDKPPFPTVEAYLESVLFAYAPRLRTLPMETMIQSARWRLRKVEGGFRPKSDPRALQRLADSGTTRNAEMLWQGFRNLRCPLLLLRAEHSDIVSPESVRLMQDAQPDMQVVEIPGVGHAPALIEPASREALQSFFK